MLEDIVSHLGLSCAILEAILGYLAAILGHLGSLSTCSEVSSAISSLFAGLFLQLCALRSVSSSLIPERDTAERAKRLNFPFAGKAKRERRHSRRLRWTPALVKMTMCAGMEEWTGGRKIGRRRATIAPSSAIIIPIMEHDKLLLFSFLLCAALIVVISSSHCISHAT